jgi:TatD DNase family protein
MLVCQKLPDIKMVFPEKNDYIDIHTHGSVAVPGIFSVETLMAHEYQAPVDIHGICFTIGIHPWHLTEKNHKDQINSILKIIGEPHIIALGETGFDRLKGPSEELQRIVFKEQVQISEEYRKPMVIHCVRAWNDLLQEHKKLKPEMPWLVHGFRGNKDLAIQLISKGMYLSFWFDFVMRPEAMPLLKGLPREKIFLETDGAEIDIRDIYNKVAADLEITVNELKTQIHSNFNKLFKT